MRQINLILHDAAQFTFAVTAVTASCVVAMPPSSSAFTSPVLALFNDPTGRAGSRRGVINVLDNGVVGDGMVDDAPAIRRLMAHVDGKTIVFPGRRTYLLKSNVASVYPVSDRYAARISRQNNFHIIANGAIFAVDPSIAFSTGIELDRNTNFSWTGGKFVGNRHGLSASQETVGLFLINNRQFHLANIEFTGFGGEGTAIAGDWNVNGSIVDMTMNGVGQCFDTAFSKNLVIRNITAVGTDNTGGTGPEHLGDKCFSNIYDVALSKYNNTGIAFVASKGIMVQNLNASNFSTAINISSGSNIKVLNNNLHNNSEKNGLSKGIGIFIHYSNGGPYSSINSPPHDISILGGVISGNGLAKGTSGVYIDAFSVKNKDLINKISVSSVAFDNYNTGIVINGFAIKGVTIGKNTFKKVLIKCWLAASGIDCPPHL